MILCLAVGFLFWNASTMKNVRSASASLLHSTKPCSSPVGRVEVCNCCLGQLHVVPNMPSTFPLAPKPGACLGW